jgi:hypothetical protein
MRARASENTSAFVQFNKNLRVPGCRLNCLFSSLRSTLLTRLQQPGLSSPLPQGSASLGLSNDGKLSVDVPILGAVAR